MALKLVWTWREELREGKDATFYEGEARMAVEGYRVIFSAEISRATGVVREEWLGWVLPYPPPLAVTGVNVEAVKAAIEAAAVYLPIVATVWEDE